MLEMNNTAPAPCFLGSCRGFSSVPVTLVAAAVQGGVDAKMISGEPEAVAALNVSDRLNVASTQYFSRTLSVLPWQRSPAPQALIRV